MLHRIFIVFCLLVAFSAVGLNAAQTEPAGNKAPAYTPITYQGVLKAVAENNGKPVLVNFWATWCPPCIMEIPHLMKLREEFDEDSLAMLGISLDEDVAPLQRFLERRPLNYDVFHGGPDVMTGFRVTGVPRTVIYDVNGRQAFAHDGYLEPEALRRAVAEVMAKKAAQ
ncbi:alkyl hydroperoxide reductase/ Thiol specific antioxidant/ Mal allergen [Alkalidesulfovibrio alkalitolerans DSM 16529]|jgi:thiol-disulfide isomerase/thioredoxin|uniref:Alkyl hydroperoxide reductase/ Thiol specific antioxidant/ Mal allergen n=1 Tax=Alkalidesulfovibrio alkalitolerans DSM 16529 TaxID=1121439 RepID=S7TCG4_9BACT|nr:TlpA disulfide reductase family protein [Alkalidesulfovibrio alkalitolerans]EPR34907.1 alkyl hydroperoxide reductase/ Thiol specific antioxidant/ Mal allergen [Alkalidesulfovibrio alkalitolerans DSM 16529]